jgi:hypothetical protein
MSGTRWAAVCSGGGRRAFNAIKAASFASRPVGVRWIGGMVETLRHEEWAILILSFHWTL